jgi:hypothetical protein
VNPWIQRLSCPTVRVAVLLHDGIGEVEMAVDALDGTDHLDGAREPGGECACFSTPNVQGAGLSHRD